MNSLYLAGSPSEPEGHGHAGRDHLRSLNRPHIEVVHDLHESPYGDRLSPVDHLERRLGRNHSLPDDVIILRSPDALHQEVVMHCPVTGAPMTTGMARAVNIDEYALQAMVDGHAPLGLSVPAWDKAKADILYALDEDGLLDERTIVKVGGSSIAGFSSKATALRKKQFPQSREEIRAMVDKNFPSEPLHLRKMHAMEAEHVWDDIRPERMPKAPWWGVMRTLTLEPPADVDVQIWSPELDRRIVKHDKTAQFADEMIEHDMWNRWDARGVRLVAPALRRLLVSFEDDRLPVDLEFLALDDGAERIRARHDWWDVWPQNTGAN